MPESDMATRGDRVWARERKMMGTKHSTFSAKRHLARGIIALSVFMLGCAWTVGGHRSDLKAPLLKGMGTHHHPISTNNAQVQRLFDQGLILSYGFNHLEAFRSFQEAARLDPDCAMCYWGMALVLGPNINSKMEAIDVPEAYKYVQKALSLAKYASEREQAYMRALSTRYVAEPPEDRARLDTLFANAMQDVCQQYPDDLDAATLLAESLMDLTPWDYWSSDGTPKPITTEVLSVLDGVLARDPNHPGALHLYIHAVEAVKPELGRTEADRLANIVPSSGHLVHMPSHIYLRVGRYHEATIANERAIEVDREYVRQCGAQGLYPLAYIPHNYHFAAATASMEGRSELALQFARELAAQIDADMMREPGLGTLQHYMVTPLYVEVRFGKWEEILDEPEPAMDLTYPRGVWHFARAMAYLRTDSAEQAAREFEQLQAVAADTSLESVTIWDINTTASLMKIAAEIVAGELAANRKNYNKAVEHLQRAVLLQDNLNYDEPPPWFYPVRESLGAVLLQANRPAEAENIYRDDLMHYPENGWSLYGLQQALDAQGKTDNAVDAGKRFAKAWQYADVTLNASRF